MMKELSMNILDIAQNSIAAEAKNIKVFIEEDIKNNRFKIEIEDDGKGMDSEIMEKVTNPFFTTRTTRKVGLGIPLFKAAAEACNGKFSIESILGKGTKITAEFQYDHIDRAPLGNIVDTIITLIQSDSNINFLYKHVKNNKEYVLDTKVIKEVLGEVPINNIDVLMWIRKELEEGLKNIDVL